MKKYSHFFGFGAASCVVAAMILLSFTAKTLAGAPPTPVGTTSVASTVATNLQAAYELLSISDHDYKGYRVKAMKQIQDAATTLGVELTAEPFKHEKQSVSDENLTTAQGLLQVLANGDVSGPALNNIITASEDIAIALMNN